MTLPVQGTSAVTATPTATAKPANGMVLIDNCWQAANADARADEDDLMAGFTSDEEEEDGESGEGNGGSVQETGGDAEPDDDFMAGFDDDSDDGAW